MLKVPKRMLVDEFVYKEYLGIERDKKPAYSEAITVKNTRIDRQTVFSRDTNDSKIVARAVIFCYADHTTPFKPYKERSLVEFDGKEYTVTNVIPIKHWALDKIWAYELEVI